MVGSLAISAENGVIFSFKRRPAEASDPADIYAESKKELLCFLILETLISLLNFLIVDD